MHCGPHVQLYNLFAADARAYKVAGDAESLPLLEMAQCIQLTWKNIFIIFDAFAANFSGFPAKFVVIPTFYDAINAMQRSRRLCSTRTKEQAFPFCN